MVIPTNLNLEKLVAKLDHQLKSAPEFQSFNPDIGFVGGGFAALSTASSFHNPTVRKLRLYADRIVRLALQHASCPFENIEVIADRFMWRPISASPSPESWHRDESRPCSGLVLGGWLNLDCQTQQFSCIPSSQQPSNGRGFAKIPKDEQKKLSAQSKLIDVPPAHILIFDETILHEVLATKKDFVSRRLFLAWRLTNDLTPFFPNIDQLLDQQAVMPLKSGQIPPSYPKLWKVNHRHKLAPLANIFIRDLQTTVSIKGQPYTAPIQHLPSLAELSKLYPAYSPQERALYKPHPIKS